MNTTDEVRRALDRAESVRFEGDKLTPSDLNWDDIDDIPEALDVWRHAKMQETAAKQVARVAGERLASLLGEGGAVGYGDSIVRFKKKRTETCIDPDGASRYMEDELANGRVQLIDIVNPNYVKRSWMSEAARDTFYRWESGDAVVSITPRDKAPKWLANLKDGDVL